MEIYNDKSFEKIEMIYKECALSYRYYLDCRFKIFTRHAIAVSATFFAVKYGLSDPDINNILSSITLFIFSLLSLAFYQMDVRHGKLAYGAVEIARKIEENIFKETDLEGSEDSPGFYHFQSVNRPPYFTHSRVFTFIYLGSSIIGVICGIAVCALLT